MFCIKHLHTYLLNYILRYNHHTVIVNRCYLHENDVTDREVFVSVHRTHRTVYLPILNAMTSAKNSLCVVLRHGCSVMHTHRGRFWERCWGGVDKLTDWLIGVFLTLSKMSRTLASDSPNHIVSSSGPLIEMKFAWHSFAMAFASSVLPQPGGP